MKKRVEEAEKLFKDGYNCSQSVFAAFTDLYGMDQEVALKLSSSFGGGIGRMREVCGAVSGMCMIAGLETGSSKKMDDAGKKYNYDIVQKLSGEFKDISGSIICRELLGLSDADKKETTPQKRDHKYYTTRPCDQLVKDAAEILERALCYVEMIAVSTPEQMEEVAALAETIWHEHYESIIGSEQVNYMIDKFQSVEAMKEQTAKSSYQYYMLVNLGGLAGYFAFHQEPESLFLSKLYIAKKNRGRDYARKVMNYLEKYCKEQKLKKLWLTVNRNNENSIKAYEKLGFEKTGTQVSDIGAGYVMDDFIMEKFLM